MGPLWLTSLTVGQSKSSFCLTEKSKVSVLIDSHKSFPIQENEHFLTVCRYVERNSPNWFAERNSGIGDRFGTRLNIWCRNQPCCPHSQFLAPAAGSNESINR